MAQTASPTQIPTVQQLAGMSPAEREAVYAQLGPDQGEQSRAQYEAFKSNANRQFMHLSEPKWAAAPAAGGGYNNTFAQGATLRWDMPTAGGAYAKGLLFNCAITITLAAGSSATYKFGQVGVMGIFNNLQITLNGQQHNIPPYIIARYVNVLTGMSRSQEPLTVFSGTKDTSVEAQLNNAGSYTLSTGANNLQFAFYIPLNAISPTNPAGLLPMMASATKPQIALTINSGLYGNDPEQNGIISGGTGTGQAITSVAGTINVDVDYLDGQNFWSPQALSMDLSGEPTVQFITDAVMNNIAQGSIQRARIQSLLQHYLVIAVCMDGKVAGQFVTALSNIAVLTLDMDSVGQNSFSRVGTGTNVSVFDYYYRMRRTYGQDFLDEGVFIPVDGAHRGITNPDNSDGVRLLNMTSGGWSDVNVGVQFTSVGNVYTPRIAVYLVSLNPAGLKVANI
jgi:hypothetical protein